MRKILLAILLFTSLPLYSADFSKIKADTLSALENYNNGNYQSAAESFTELYYEVKKVANKDISARFRLSLYAALSYRGIKSYAPAIAWFDTSIALLKKSPSLFDYITLEAYRAEMLEGLGKHDEALISYENILNSSSLTDNSSSVILYQMANIYATSKNDLLKAKTLCERASLSETVKDHKALITRCEIIYGKYYESINNLNNAKASFNKALKISNEAELNLQAYLHLAKLYERTQENKEARINYENALFLIIENDLKENLYTISDKIVELLPESENTQTQANRMRYLASLEFVDNAFRAILYRLSALYYKISGDMNDLYPVAEEGEAYLRELKENLKHKDEYRLELAFYIAYALTELAAYEDALDIALQLKNYSGFKKVPKFHYALEEILALNYFHLDNVKKAREHIERAKKLFPENATELQKKRFNESLQLIG